MANEQNLRPWKPGQSGNPRGMTKGTKHASTWIQELLNDEDFNITISKKRYKGAPLRAMVKAQVIRAMDGDTRAFDVLLKHGWGKIEPEPPRRPENPIIFINNVPISGDDPVESELDSNKA